MVRCAGPRVGRQRHEGAIYLFHRHALRQVARLVDIGALGDGGVVGEELHRDGIKDGRNKGIDLRQFDRRQTAERLLVLRNQLPTRRLQGLSTSRRCKPMAPFTRA